MKKRTKKYTPRQLSNPLDTISKHSIETISDESFTSLGILFLGALDGMTGDSANEEMWSNLVCALNTSLLLCQAGIKSEMTRTVDAALDAMVKVQMRARNGHGWQLGNHYDTVRAGMTVHHEHMTKQPKHVLKQALAEVMRRTGNLEVAERLAA